MWSAESGGLARSDKRRLLLVLRADALDVGWAVDGGNWHSQGLALAAAAADQPPINTLQQALLQLQAQLTRPGSGLAGVGRALTVLVAAPWLGRAALPWSDRLLDPASALAEARSALAARGFMLAADDLLRLDAAPALGRPRTALRVPEQLLPALLGFAQALGARLVSVQSLNAVAAAWAAQRADSGRPGLVAVLGGGVLQLLPADGTAAAVGHEMALQVDADLAAADLAKAVAGLWQRAALRFPALAAIRQLPLLCLDRPAPDAALAAPLQGLAWPGDGQDRADLDRALLHHAVARPTLDALAADGVRRLPGRIAALAGALCLLVAGGLAWSAAQRQAEVDASQSAARIPAPTAPPALLSRVELAELRAVNAVVRQINLPLPALLRMLQPPRDIQVTLLGLDLAADGGADDSGGARPVHASATGSGTTGNLKLAVEAMAGNDMTRYLAFLASRDGVLSAQLLRHEADPARPDAPIRFQVELAWRR